MALFRILYWSAAVLYVLLILFWGRHDMGRISQDYRRTTERLTSNYAQERAEREVAMGCRQAVGGESAPGYVDCLRASTSLIQKRAAVLSAELLRERRQVFKKMVLFYGLAGVILIALPLALIYVVMIFLTYLLRNIRFKKE